MSCEQNTIAYEACLERFWEYMTDYDFQAFIYEHFLSHQEQWKEKEFGFSEYPYENAFEYVWKWDCEGMFHDMKRTIEKYVEANK